MKYIKYVADARFEVLTVVSLRVKGFSDSLNHMSSHPRRHDCFLFLVFGAEIT
jgi:hypothetical protein